MSNTLRAALWMIGAIVSFTSMAVAGRFASLDHDTFEIMFFRSILGIVIVLAVATVAGTLGQINRDRFGLHFARNLAHFTGQNLWFFALPLIPLAQLFALEFTGPVWVLLLAPLLLKERLTVEKLAYAGMGFIGIMIVARPDFTDINTGVLAGATAAIAFAFTAIFTRKLTATASITCILFYLTTMQATFGAIMVFYDGQVSWPTMQGLPWLAIIGVAGLLAHFCLTQALTIAPASVVMPLDFARLPLVAVIGMVFYNESLDGWVFLGAVLIFGANYLNVTRAK